MLKSGERLVATARNVGALEGLAQLATKESDQQPQLLTVRLDVSDQAQVDDAFAQAVARFGRVDVVVNNAGYGLHGELESLSDDDIRALLDVNLWGVIRVTRAAVRVFREVNRAPVGGRLLQISSVGGFTVLPTLSIYHLSKFAIEGFSEAVAREMKPEWNIRITVVQPGGFKTDWGGRSLVTTEPHPAYAGSPAEAVRTFLGNPETAKLIQGGDPRRAADVMVALSRLEEPPFKLPLGPDAVGLIQSKLDMIQAELNQWREMSMSTATEVPDELITIGAFSETLAGIQKQLSNQQSSKQ